MSENMFEVALRSKIRFQLKGVVSVEELWDLSVENLDIVFKGLNSQLKQVKEESLLNVRTKQDEELDLKIEIVKHIFKTKLDERNLKLKAKEKREEKQKLMSILSGKQDEALQNLSADELQKRIAELDEV